MVRRRPSNVKEIPETNETEVKIWFTWDKTLNHKRAFIAPQLNVKQCLDATSRPLAIAYSDINKFNEWGTQISYDRKVRALAAQKSHRKIAMITVAASGLSAIPLQKSQGFSLRWPQKKRNQEARSQHGRKLRQPCDFVATATTGR